MAPCGGKMATRTTRRNLPKLKLNKKMKTTATATAKKQKQIPVTESDAVKLSDETEAESGCSTPKAERFRIPEIVTCPPAPKKQRAVSDCSLRRSPIAFFAPPELELFFVSSLPDISV